MKQVEFNSKRLDSYTYECEYAVTYTFPLRKSRPIKLERFHLFGFTLTFGIEGNPFESFTLGRDSIGHYFKLRYNGRNRYWRI